MEITAENAHRPEEREKGVNGGNGGKGRGRGQRL
jgi:hypothetical protein